MLEPGSQREYFDIPRDVAYFNTAYNGPLLNSSRAALLEGAASKSRPWERSSSDFFEAADEIRRLASDLLGGDAEGYAITPSATYGLTVAARAIEPRLEPGDRILLMSEEFPANVLPWQRAAAERGAEIVTVARGPEGWTGSIVQAVGRQAPRVVALSHCHWTSGEVLDLETIAREVRERGGWLVLDLTQSWGAMPCDLTAVRPDFVAAAGYKWLLCPYGFGLLHVAPEWRDGRPLEESWLARNDSENFAGLVTPSPLYRPGAVRFDVSETCVATILPGAVAALTQLKAWSVPGVAKALGRVNAAIAAEATALDLTVPPSRGHAPHMFGVGLPPTYEGDLVSALKARNVHVSRRGRLIRFAPHLHVDDLDLARLFGALRTALRA